MNGECARGPPRLQYQLHSERHRLLLAILTCKVVCFTVASPPQVQRHDVLNEKDEAVQLCSSVECKGIIGNDGRHYILDLLRTFPPDLNFLPVEGEELPPETQKQGFPRLHRHRLACLRQELIEAFVEHRCVT